MYLIYFYVPSDHLEHVKNAMFEAGAGKIGHYDHCAWQIKGQGQFKPLEGSDAYIGVKHQLETVDEYKVEIVCEESHITDVIAALHQAHPYETPAYQVIKTENF